MANRGDQYQINYGDEVLVWAGYGQWSAVYVNGKLKDYGDHDNVHERMLLALGFESEQSDDWLLGSDREPAETLAEAYAFRDRREADIEKAAELRRQAAELEERAGLLEAKSQ